jgi:protein-L-isoaspartate(D-aspartate) O-methyltransferase
MRPAFFDGFQDMNYEQARFNMVEQQIRPWEVLDQHVLDIMLHTPREDFVPASYRNLAFADTNIPLEHGQEMMRPNVEGRLLQSLNIQKTDIALEIGTGSGYLTACLAQLAGHVYSVDIFPDFIAGSARKLEARRITNVTLSVADAAAFETVQNAERPYDVIAITGAVPYIPDYYKNALTVGGRLFVITGDLSVPIMEAKLITRVAISQWVQESLFETRITPLLNVQQPKAFKF